MKSLGLLPLTIALLLLNGCQPPTTPADDRPNVVATNTILADLTGEIGGEAIALTSILTPGDDPHVYEPVPQDTITLEQADLILYNGYNLEPALIRLMANVSGRRLAVGEQISPLAMAEDGQQVPDPHVWGNARNGIIMVEVIRDTLVEMAPQHSGQFRANAAALIAQLEAVDSWIKAQIATIPPENRKLVTTHDAFAYYTAAYGLEMLGSLIGISTEEQPSAQTVQTLSDAIRAAGIPAIFAETTINDALITTVAQEAGVELAPQPLYSDSIGAPGSPGDSYIGMLIANTTAIVTALGGEVTPPPAAVTAAPVPATP
ncbi:MAG: metal ABC transporter substrate-binding protein [Spirulina sp. DLM2.Bin59]|nr:MAG: metal ABC transporter substrate-binding protein [Spirulina sp. DLM2.Bin59]